MLGVFGTLILLEYADVLPSQKDARYIAADEI